MAIILKRFALKYIYTYITYLYIRVCVSSDKPYVTKMHHFSHFWAQFSANTHVHTIIQGFPGGSDREESARSAGDLSSIPVWGRSPGERKGNPLQFSCLENSMEGGAWWAREI